MLKKRGYVAHICRRMELEANKSQLPPGFFVRLIWTESRFDRDAISPKGASGIAQFMPATAKSRGLVDRFDPKSALRTSAHYLGELRTKFGNLGRAAAAYNAGEGGARRWLSGKSGLPDETEDYVFSITGFTSDKWKQADQPNADYRLDRSASFQQACNLLPVSKAPPQPRYAYAHNNQGVLYEKQGQFDRAIAHYDRAIQIRSNFPKAYFNRALAYRNQGDLDKAIADYTTAIRLQSNYPDAYNNRGVAHHHKKDYVRAAADYSKAIRLNPKLISALHNRAVAHRALGKFNKALFDLNAALKLQPKYIQALANRGVTYVRIGENEKAIADFRRVLKTHPKHKVAVRALKRLGAAP